MLPFTHLCSNYPPLGLQLSLMSQKTTIICQNSTEPLLITSNGKERFSTICFIVLGKGQRAVNKKCDICNETERGKTQVMWESFFSYCSQWWKKSSSVFVSSWKVYFHSYKVLTWQQQRKHTHTRACEPARAHTPTHFTASAVIIQTNPLTDPSCCSLNGVQSVFWA